MRETGAAHLSKPEGAGLWRVAERDAGGNGVTADGRTPPGNADVSSAALEPHLTANRENYAAAKPPLVCDPPSAPLTDRVGSGLDREVDLHPDEGMRSRTGLGHGIGSAVVD